MLQKELIPIYKILKHVEEMIMTKEDLKDYLRSKECYACKRTFKRTKEFKKCKDHDHITGKY